GLDDQRGTAPVFLLNRNEEEGFGIRVRQILNEVGGDADDGDPVSGFAMIVKHTEALAESGLSGPEVCGSILSEDGSPVIRCAVPCTEVATEKQRVANGGKVSGRGSDVGHDGAMRGIADGLMFDFDGALD